MKRMVFRVLCLNLCFEVEEIQVPKCGLRGLQEPEAVVEGT